MARPNLLTDDGPSVYFLSSCCYSLPSCHIHNHNELLFLVSGKLRLENNLDIVEVEAPAVILHNSYTMHRAELMEGHYVRYIINFDDSTLDTIPGLREAISFFKTANMTVIRLTEDMWMLLEHYAKRYSFMSAEDGSQNMLTCLILYEITKYRSAENTVKIRAAISYINDVMHFISEHYGESFTLDELAAQFYISRAKLASDFSSTTGMTVKQYTTLVRMNVARGMILDGISVADTAHACGYSNTSNFITTFTRYFGDSPARYRHAAAEANP
ncbi:MAG: helix-turn-helix transcriptional regulator [Clostridia bacterium]|nr:helix-turn-helix transcriptional regulator [Clostridia bacterium]